MQKVTKQMLVVILFLSQEATHHSFFITDTSLYKLFLSLCVFKTLSMYLVF